ncbi:MAG TPA: glycerol-3-phosphate 1-O-acyltransferase [Mycobacterium sp.]
MNLQFETNGRREESTIVLAEAHSRFERVAISRWAAQAHPDATVVGVADVDLDRVSLDTELVPARVVWLPPAHRGERRVAAADLLALTNPRKPRAGAQPRIARRSPDRVHVVEGESASVRQLRDRYQRSVDGGEPFESFVAMQASLSAERAERQLVGDRYKVPRLVVERIGSSARFRAGAAELAERLGRSEASVVREATDQLGTFVATQSRLMGDLFNEIFRRMHERAWTVSADVEALERLRELNKTHALVFLPSHRTYMDPRVLAAVLRENDFPPNHVLGGNNMAFWPIGAVGRRAGMVFIRRKFGDDPVYRFAMRSYLSHLVEKRFNLEWYIEGGRSRTGKLREPMYGLLAYVADAVEQTADADVMLVPTSIVYDQLPEVAAMAAESGGGTKKAETLGWLLRYARAQQTPSGSARVRFGEPFSLRAALAEAGTGRARLEKVAFRIMDGINAATPITATSLASFALLGADRRAFTRREIETILTPLLGYIEKRGLPGPDPALCRGRGLDDTLGELTCAGVLDRYDGGWEPVWEIRPGNHGVAAYYRNGAMHHFVNRAIVELALLAEADSPIQPAAAPDELLTAARDEALRIRDLLKFEFFFPPKQRFIAQLRDELNLLTHSPTELYGSPWPTSLLWANSSALVARRTLQPFFDAQLVVAEQLVALGSEWIDRDDFLKRSLGLGQQLSLQGKVHSPDSVSRELYTAALKLADNRGLLEADDPALRSGRRAEFVAEIEQMRARLARIAEIESGVAR